MVKLIVILSLLACMVINSNAADKFFKIAELKGHDAKKLHIMAWCFWVPPIGYLYVISLPDLKIRELLQDRVNYSQSQQQNNSYDLSKISEMSKSSNDNIESWVCKKCGERNPKTRMTCQKCDTYKNAHL